MRKFRFGNTVVHALLVISALAACRRDKPEEPAAPAGGIGTGHGVYIVNEGNFQWGNASVSYFDPATNAVREDLFQAANGTGVGDVLESMALHNGRAYLVVNNSAKVEVVDPVSFVSLATITGFSSPRYFLAVGADKAYVTEMQGNQVRVVDLGTGTITGNIPCPGVTQELVVAAGKVFVTNESKGFVYVVDPSTDQITDSIAVSRGGNSIAVDANGKPWVACSGGGGTPPGLYRIDPQSVVVDRALPFPSPSGHPWRLCTNGDGTVLYYLNGGVYRMSIGDTSLPAGPFIPADGRNLYGLGVDPQQGVVYVADAIDYTQRGRIFRYGMDGAAQGDFLAGRIPNGFVFR